MGRISLHVAGLARSQERKAAVSSSAFRLGALGPVRPSWLFCASLRFQPSIAIDGFATQVNVRRGAAEKPILGRAIRSKGGGLMRVGGSPRATGRGRQGAGHTFEKAAGRLFWAFGGGLVAGGGEGRRAESLLAPGG